MAKHIDTKVVKFVGYSDYAGNTASYNYDAFIGCRGLLIIMQTERSCRKYPGEHYVSFYPYEPGEKEQRHFDTPRGDLAYEGHQITLNGDHTFLFEVGDYLTDDDKEQISSNLFWGVKSMVF